MPVARVFGFVLAGLLVVTVFSSVGSAQLRKRQPVLRWMGQGFGDGYHQCNRGPISDYYNPYSSHNSLLQSDLNPHLLPDSYETLNRSRFNQSAPQRGSVASLLVTNRIDYGHRKVSDNSVAPLDSDRSQLGQQRRLVRPHADFNMESADSTGNAPYQNDSIGNRSSFNGEESKRGFLKTGFRNRSPQAARPGNLLKSLSNGS